MRSDPLRIDLGDGADNQEGIYSSKISFDDSTINLVQTPFGVIIELKDCEIRGEVGAPGLASCVVRAALPPLARVLSATGEPIRVMTLSKEPVLIAPVQLPRAGATNDAPGGGRKKRDNERVEVKPSTSLPPEEPPVEPFPVRQITAPDEKQYQLAVEHPAPLARLISVENVGMVPVAVIEINPVRLQKDGSLEFCPEIRLVVRYDRSSSQREESKDAGRDFSESSSITSRSQARRMVDLVRAQVINPRDVLDFSRFFPELITSLDYIIITDSHSWNEKTLSQTGGLDGDLVAVFQRLIDWKKKRGIKARVITISDIVNGVYGNFTAGVRDLQEAIRNFLKWAHKSWGISWVLLGGDTNIIPVRVVPGASEGHIDVQDTNPPPDDRSFWTGSFLKMKVVNPGVWWPGSRTDHFLVRADNGLLIPYDESGTSSSTNRGWYFTTDDTYSTRSSIATQYVKVNGPEAEVKGRLQWLYKWNLLPTDLYYGSLVGMNYNIPGKHDWDLLDNGIYGQHTNDLDLDGVSYEANISIGRAPVASVQEASAFVDKVIAYEQFRKPDGSLLDLTWPRRISLYPLTGGAGCGLAQLAPIRPKTTVIIMAADSLTPSSNSKISLQICAGGCLRLSLK
jgi:hypothetical protein